MTLKEPLIFPEMEMKKGTLRRTSLVLNLTFLVVKMLIDIFLKKIEYVTEREGGEG